MQLNRYNTQSDEKRYKIILIGDCGTGKDYPCYNGPEFEVKRINIQGQVVRLQIWDSAGSQRYQSIPSMFSKMAFGVIFNYDITNYRSFENIYGWMKESEEYSPKNAIRILLGNKCDKESRQVTYEEGQKLADSFGMQFYETSAKEDLNVEKAFIALAKNILDKLGDTACYSIHQTNQKQKQICC